MKRDAMNQGAGQESAAHPREEEAAMQSQEQSLDAQIVRDARAAKVFWRILLAMRLVIPLYVIYAIYLYWTLPPSAYLSGGY